MALADNALTTVATMEAVLGLASGSADAQLERVINQASAIAESFAGRVFYRNAAISEKHEGQATPILLLKQAPLNSITSVTYLSGNAEGSSTYEIHDADVGSIYRVSGTWGGVDPIFGDSSQTVYTGQGRKVWTIVYDGGWYTPKQEDDGAGTRNLPFDIEQAAIDIAVALYRSEGRDPTLTGERLMEASQSFASGGSAMSSGAWLRTNVPSAAFALSRYRRGGIA